MELIRRNLKRARDAKTNEEKSRYESDILWNIKGMVSVWAVSDGLNKKQYALEILSRIEELNKDFEEDEKLRMSPADIKYKESTVGFDIKNDLKYREVKL